MIGGHCFGFNAQQTSSLPTRERQRDCSHRTQKDQKGRDGYMRFKGGRGVLVRLSRRKGGKRPEERKRGKEDPGTQKYPKQSIMNQ